MGVYCEGVGGWLREISVKGRGWGSEGNDGLEIEGVKNNKRFG